LSQLLFAAKLLHHCTDGLSFGGTVVAGAR
jgi:hypothetical protein